MRILPGLPIVLLALAAGPVRAEDADTAAGRAAENRWSEAFVSGDARALEALLAPDYVSVSATGTDRSKAEVIALAVKYAAAHPGQHADPMPASSTIQVRGDAAVVRHHGGADVSVDVFYRDGAGWRAWYSQHTALGAKAG